MNEPAPFKLLNNFKDEVAKERGKSSWVHITNHCGVDFKDEVENEAIERYVNHIREEAYKRGWNEALYWATAHVETKPTFLQEVDKQSILKGLKP